MKSIFKKVAGIALTAVLVLGMSSCSSGSTDDHVLPPAPAKETVATPEFSIATSLVKIGTSVTITCATEGAKIYYQLIGSGSSDEIKEYTDAIIITENTTIDAIAEKDGMNDSQIATKTYYVETPDGFYKECKVGDFILKDGAILSKDSTPEINTVAAVIVSAAFNDKPALGVGIVHDRTGLTWCTSQSSGFSTNITDLQGTKTTGYRDGSDSWKLLVKNCSDLKEATAETIETIAENYPAFNYCRKYGIKNGFEGNLAEGWYLPTIAELNIINKNKRIVNESLNKAGQSTFKSENGGYWSCSQDSSDSESAQILDFKDGSSSKDKKNNNNESYISVCAVRAFN